MMSLPVAFSRQITRLLSTYAGAIVHIVQSEPITEGWSARFQTAPWPWVSRCVIKTEADSIPTSVIVKVQHPSIPHRRDLRERFLNELAALEFLHTMGSFAGPRLLANDSETGLLVMEDLGRGLALEDLLVGSDTLAAAQGLIAFATALGKMHAGTAGHAQDYYALRCAHTTTDAAFDRISIAAGYDVENLWKHLLEIVASRSYLPAPDNIKSDISEIMHFLSEPGPYLAFSNGDVSPANCRLTDTGVRFLDFENACFHHALLDVAALRFPFPACPCWSRLPEEVSHEAESAYQKQVAHICPGILDPAEYAHGLTIACAAWTLLRMVRLPKLEKNDEPQPMGFSRRGQLLDTISTTVGCAQQYRSLPALTAWLLSVEDALRERWPYLPSAQPFYPAFQ